MYQHYNQMIQLNTYMYRYLLYFVSQKYFIYLGNESLGIYLLHYFFLFPLTILQAPLREMSLAFAPTVTVATVIAFIIIALTLGANYVISKNKILLV